MIFNEERLTEFMMIKERVCLPLLLIVLILASCNSEQKQARPNILFIAIDDLRPDLGCYGNKLVKSPNLDKIAEEGALFSHHYVSVPTCGPSRHSLLTGMRPATSGHLNNNISARLLSEKMERDTPETFIHHLRNNGYYTIGIGKISHSADGLVYGYTESPSTKRELPHSWDELLFDSGKWQTGWNSFFGYADGENRQSLKKQVTPYEKGEVDDEGYVDGLTAGLAISKLQELKNLAQPFFLGVGFFKPHLPFNAPQKYWDLYEIDSIPISSHPDIPENVNLASLHNSGEFNSYQLGDEKPSLEKALSTEYAKKIRHAYYACVSYVDAQIGRVHNELSNLGLEKNTIVVVWSDHGWHLGGQRIWGKHTIFENALRSVLIVKDPKNLQPRTIHSIVETVDIYPTLMELCDLKMPYHTDGESMAPLLNGNDSEWENAAYSYFRNGISLRTDRYRLTRYFRSEKPTIELYDHLNDPMESNNVAMEFPKVANQLMPLLEKGNTGLYD